MTELIHVLGYGLAQHNSTLLRFFNDDLANDLPPSAARNFMVCTDNVAALPVCPLLNLSCYPDNKTLTKALIKKAQSDRNCRFFFHGQFNMKIWLALLIGQIKSHQFFWHIWGGDWHENPSVGIYRLTYPIRYFARQRVGHVFATMGDMESFQQQNPHIPASLLYFPTKLDTLSDPIFPEKDKHQPLTVLIGNSGDQTNRHIEALQALHDQFGRDIKLILPFGYPENNETYIAEVRRQALRLYPEENIKLITDNLAFNDYIRLLKCCDFGYFDYRRQQGIGTLCLMIQHAVPFVLSRQNPFSKDLHDQGIPFLFSDAQLDRGTIDSIRQQLNSLDRSRIAFFYPATIAVWQDALKKAAGVADQPPIASNVGTRSGLENT